jgi:hypothetical protein
MEEEFIGQFRKLHSEEYSSDLSSGMYCHVK